MSGIVIGAAIVGCFGNQEPEVGYASFTTLNNGGVSSAYVNGVDVTDERLELEELVKENIAMELGVEKEELEFRDFCMLEDEGVTVEVRCEGEWKTVAYKYKNSCNICRE